jgi:methyltransferase
MRDLEASSIVYIALVAAAALAAILERLHALRHETRLVEAGAEEVAPWVYHLMVPVYTLVFPAAVAEHVLLHRRPPLPFAAAMVILYLSAKGLKLWAIRSLGDLWTMRVILPRPLRVVTGGPYRHVRHPNYVAVLFEVTTLPLAGGAWITAAAACVLFLALLRARVRTEERALLARPEYAAAMGERRRFVPGGGR